MKTKRKLLISMLAFVFVLLAVVATVAIIFALTQQTITTSLNIVYTAREVDAKVSATVSVANGTPESMVTANGKATSITFRADNVVDPNGNSLVPASAINLTSQDNYVVFEYTFQNTGDNDLVVNFEYSDTEESDSNIEFSYARFGSDFVDSHSAMLIEGRTTAIYDIKVKISNVSKNAELSGNISWTLENHDHSYVEENYISGSTTYTAGVCSCGKSDPTSNIVIAKPDNAQSILDSNINGKTIVFSAGNYSGLDIRPSAETATIYDPIWLSGDGWNPKLDKTNGEIQNAEISLEEFLAEKIGSTRFHHYVRNIENVVLVGADDATFFGNLYLRSSIFSKTEGFLPYDMVRVIKYTESDMGHYPHVSVDGLTVKGMNFKGSRINFYSYLYDESIKNLTIENNTFDGNGAKVAAVDLDKDNFRGTTTELLFNNVVVKNNEINNYYQGVIVLCVENLTVSGNTISNTGHNAVGVHGFGVGFGGTILVHNNIISNTEDRALRFNFATNATLTITENEFTNSLDGDQLLKASELTNCSFSFENNTYAGAMLETESGSNMSADWIVIADNNEKTL